ncbi:hypothetical protein FDP41_006107 [Naegleria fowleri]|uniref:RWP-RK domain-containing protein n=1 Tax=Naegleria fowleri TaxID=5763 RepID=A0A6A5B8M7_NAEFO|nr:uncharacterized protein FDP41_006107 [Naegleria fowleri]KAF0974633.1 hypothetical protein FDP41_006107 [Naegleria fowleri]CAG4712299.1 unnamed protein product [Naegleria fowleri]
MWCSKTKKSNDTCPSQDEATCCDPMKGEGNMFAHSVSYLSHANVPYVHPLSNCISSHKNMLPSSTPHASPVQASMHACSSPPSTSAQTTHMPEKKNSPSKSSKSSRRSPSPKTNHQSPSNLYHGIKKQHKTSKVSSSYSSKSKISLKASDLIRVMALPQSMAAKELGVSLSTLKRRFYDLKMGRWPGLANPTGYSHYCSSLTSDSTSVNSNDSSSSNLSRKAELSYIMNPTNLDESYLDQIALAVLNISFKQHVFK